MNIFVRVMILLVLFTSPVQVQAAEPLTITAVGDIMMGTDWPESLLPPENGQGIFNGVKEYLSGDIVLGNLEGPITTVESSPKCKTRSRNCYAFRTPPSMAPRLAEAGFNALNVANNHAYDFGARGISETLSLLDTIGIQPVGGKRVATFEIRGVHVAVAGFSYFDTPYSYSILQLPAAAKVVADLKKEHDIVVVTFHGGAEGKSARHIQNEPEVYLGEKRGNVIAFAHSVIDAGADLVIGHGPHVLRAMEEYKGKLIAYSMGNFLTYERFNISGPSGLSAVLTVRIDPETGNFLNGEIHPVRLKGPGLPFIDPDGTSIRMLESLSKEDISEQVPLIASSGIIKSTMPELAMEEVAESTMPELAMEEVAESTMPELVTVEALVSRFAVIAALEALEDNMSSPLQTYHD